MKNQAVIHAAYPNEAWPGKAAVVTSRIHIHKGSWKGKFTLNGRIVPQISAFLSERKQWTPKQLIRNQNTFKGNEVTGEGFMIDASEAQICLLRIQKIQMFCFLISTLI